MQASQARNLYAHWGRGLTLALALAVPVLDSLDHLSVGGGRTLPVTTILMFIVVVLAVGSVLRSGTSLKRWYFVPLLLMAAVLAGTLGAAGRTGALVALARVWSLILFAAAVTVHFAEQPLERTGVLTAAALGGMAAALVALASLFGISSAGALSNVPLDRHSSWSLFVRPSGPLADGEALGWLMAVLAPVAAAGVFAVEGKVRELIALAFTLLWAGLVVSLSYTAPVAALTGLLILLLSRSSLSRPYPGLPFLLVAVSLLLALNPLVKARWDDKTNPVAAVADAVDVVDGEFADDSLQIAIANEGQLAWPKDWQAGVHLLAAEGFRDNRLKLSASTWMGRRLGRRIAPGETASVLIPFNVNPGSGFLVVDLRGPGGYLSIERGMTCVLNYRARVDEDGFLRLQTLSLVRFEPTLFAVMRSLRHQLPPALTQGRWEVWRDALALFKGRPLTGLGPGAMQSLLGYGSGNLYLQTAVDEGVIGLVILLGTLLVLFIALSLRRDTEGTLYAALMIVVLVYGALDYVQDHQPVAVLTAILFGLAWAAAFERHPQSSESERNSRQPA